MRGSHTACLSFFLVSLSVAPSLSLSPPSSLSPPPPLPHTKLAFKNVLVPQKTYCAFDVVFVGVNGWQAGLELLKESQPSLKESQPSAGNIYYNRDYLCVVKKV